MPSSSPPQARKPLSIVIADHQPLTRALLSDALARENDIEIVAEVADAQAAMLAAGSTPTPDILLLRSDLPAYSPFAAARALRSQSVSTRIAFLFPVILDCQLDEAINCHASGFFSFEDPVELIVRGLRQLITHGSFRSSSIQTRLTSTPVYGQSKRSASPLTTLTARERDILRLIAEGMTQKQIAERIGLAPKTIDNHAGKVMTKLGIHNRVLLTRYAIREGLVTLGDPPHPVEPALNSQPRPDYSLT